MHVCVFTSTHRGATFETCCGTRRPDITETMGLGEDGEAASRRFLALNEPAVVVQRGCLGGHVQTNPSPHSPGEIPGCRCQRDARKSGGRGPTLPAPRVKSGQMPSSFPPGSTRKSARPLPRRTPACRGWNVLLEAGLHVLGMEFPQWEGSLEKVNSGACPGGNEPPQGPGWGFPWLFWLLTGAHTFSKHVFKDLNLGSVHTICLGRCSSGTEAMVMQFCEVLSAAGCRDKTVNFLWCVLYHNKKK